MNNKIFNYPEINNKMNSIYPFKAFCSKKQICPKVSCSSSTKIRLWNYKPILELGCDFFWEALPGCFERFSSKATLFLKTFFLRSIVSSEDSLNESHLKCDITVKKSVSNDVPHQHCFYINPVCIRYFLLCWSWSWSWLEDAWSCKIKSYKNPY